MKKLGSFFCLLMMGWALNAGAETPGLTMDKNIFKPSTDKVVTTVLIPNDTGVVEVILYNSAGEAIKKYATEPTVPNMPLTFTWDGKNDAGDPVASGLYFFNFRVDLGTYLKKLLLVR